MENKIPSVESDNDPLDATQVNIRSWTGTVNDVMKVMAKGGMTPKPSHKWTTDQQSLLIESLLVHIPLPALYGDCLDDNTWTIIDGNSRLDAIKNYVDGNYALSGLEFLPHLAGKRYDDLGRPRQRRIMESRITMHQVMPGVPDDVKYAIIDRIRSQQG